MPVSSNVRRLSCARYSHRKQMWHHYFQRASLQAGFGAHRACSVFLVVTKQWVRSSVCGLSVLRRPAHCRGIASASSRHRKNSSTVRGRFAPPRTSFACSASGTSAVMVAPRSRKPVLGACTTCHLGNKRGVPLSASKCQSWVKLSTVAPSGQPSNQVPLQASLNARLTNHSTGHFVACRVWAKKA